MSVGVPELERVHEDGDRHHVALGRGPLDQRAVPGVQRAHGRDQPDGAPDGPGGVEGVATLGDGLDDRHVDWSTGGR